MTGVVNRVNTCDTSKPPTTTWNSAEVSGVSMYRARTQAMIDAALPNMINTFRRTPDGKRLLVTSYSDHSSPTLYPPWLT
mgnify:CR=1 FL=1